MPAQPPLAGKPPFATDEPDSVYQNTAPQPRLRQKPPADPNSRTSAYDVYNNYLDGSNRDSGVGALGMGLLNGDMDDDDDDDDNDDRNRKPSEKPSPRNDLPPVAVAAAVATHPQTSQPAVPLAAPRPGYAAPVSALNLSRPAPSAVPNGRQPAAPEPLRIQPGLMPSRSPISVPSTPHPLQPPMTPITPVFARPSRSPAPRDIKFVAEPIMRGNSEDALIPKRGEKGDDFWRRFSMVAHVEKAQHKESTWLRKTRNGSSRLSRWVWFVGMCLLVCIVAAIVIVWLLTHNKPSNQQPLSLGGHADESGAASSITATISGTASVQAKAVSTSSPHVSPTNTVVRRAPYADPTPAPGVTWRRDEIEHGRRQHMNRTPHH